MNHSTLKLFIMQGNPSNMNPKDALELQRLQSDKVGEKRVVRGYNIIVKGENDFEAEKVVK